MQTRVVRRACRLFVIGAILLSGGSALLTEYTERITTPAYSYAAISRLPISTEVQDHHDSLDRPDNIVSYSTIESIKDDGFASYIPQEEETITTPAAEHSSISIDTTETSSEKSIQQADDTMITDTSAEQVFTKIQTKIKYIETILTKAVIEPYRIDGQIEGIQITGLDKIFVAKDLLLKSGDIIRTVNGYSLNSKKRAYDIFKKARKLPTMEIELLRDGKSTKLLYCLK